MNIQAKSSDQIFQEVMNKYAELYLQHNVSEKTYQQQNEITSKFRTFLQSYPSKDIIKALYDNKEVLKDVFDIELFYAHSREGFKTIVFSPNTQTQTSVTVGEISDWEFNWIKDVYED